MSPNEQPGQGKASALVENQPAHARPINAMEHHSPGSLRLLYLFIFSGVGLFFTFLNVHYKNIGLSGTQIGLIGTVGSLIGMFSAVIWGMVNDRYGRIRLLLGVTGAGVILATAALAQATAIPLAFGWILLIAGMLNLFNSPITPIVDNLTLSVLGEHRDRYGHYRAWGTLGFILTSFSIGFLYERIGLRSMFPAYILTILLFLAATLRAPVRPIKLGGSPLSGLGQMVRQPLYLFFGTSVILVWMANVVSMSFVSITMKSMGGSESLIGIAWSIGAIVELPIMLYSDRLLRRFGAPRLMMLGFAMYAMRMVLYAIMPHPAWVLGINLLNAVSFVPFWIGAVSYANKLAPDHIKATGQGMLAALSGLSNMVGGVLGGVLFDQIGPSGLFLVMAGSCLLALLIFSIGQRKMI